MSQKSYHPGHQFKFVSVLDAAIDEAATLEANSDAVSLYRANYCESTALQYLKFKEGFIPTWYVCQVIGGVTRARIIGKTQRFVQAGGKFETLIDHTERYLQFIQHSLVDIIGGNIRVEFDQENGKKIASLRTLDQINPTILVEMGMAIYEQTGEATAEEKKSLDA